MEMFDLTGKVAVVTGGGTGLGEAAARALAGAGAALVLSGRNQANLEKVAADIRSGGGRALPVIADVSRGLGDAMPGIEISDIPANERLQERGW